MIALIVQWVVAAWLARLIVINAQWYWAHVSRCALAPPNLCGLGNCVGFSRGLWRISQASVRGAYYLGIPYLALVNGLVPLRWYALAESDGTPASWYAGFSLTAGFFLLGACLIWLHKEWLLVRAARVTLPLATQRARLSQPWGGAFIIWETLYLQAHWLFYRAGLLAWFGDMVMGTLGGAALVVAEWLLDLRVLHAIRQPETSETYSIYLLLLLCNGALFIYTRNLGWMVCAHAVIWLGWLWLMEYWYRPLALRAAHAENSQTMSG